MKKLVKPIYAGISGKLNKKTNKYDFKVDFENNSKNDVVKFIEPYFQQSNIGDNVYWFGYSFNDGQSNPRRDEFIEFIKHVQPERLVDPDDEWSGFGYDDKHLTESDLDTMIARSLNRIKLSNYSVDLIVYPESKSGNLVKMIVSCICRYLNRVTTVCSKEINKSDPQDVEFDFKRFNRDLELKKIDVPDFVTEEYIEDMMEKATHSKSFSLRKYIRPTILRNYVSNFYNANNHRTEIANADVILIVDDFGTTGTTIRELVRNIDDIKRDAQTPDYEIYIFTLMGNKRAN